MTCPLGRLHRRRVDSRALEGRDRDRKGKTSEREVTDGARPGRMNGPGQKGATSEKNPEKKGRKSRVYLSWGKSSVGPGGTRLPGRAEARKFTLGAVSK